MATVQTWDKPNLRAKVEILKIGGKTKQVIITSKRGQVHMTPHEYIDLRTSRRNRRIKAKIDQIANELIG